MPDDNSFQISFDMDDLQITYRHPKWGAVERKLQDNIHIVKKLAQKNGFKFSTSKTSMLPLAKLLIPVPKELRLGNIRIQKSETVKYLGLVFDSKLNCKAHIQQLMPKCYKALNRMRIVSPTEGRADQKP